MVISPALRPDQGRALVPRDDVWPGSGDKRFRFGTGTSAIAVWVGERRRRDVQIVSPPAAEGG